MIHIEATGGLKKDRELAEDIMWFCVETLMPRHKNLIVELELTKCADDGAMGYAYMTDDEKDFTIEVDHRLSRVESRDKFIETVCHEMVHVWQMATKRMKDTVRDGYKQWWKCKDGKYRNYTETAYERKPWETQAYAMEGPLAQLFKKEYYGENTDSSPNKLVFKKNT